MGEPAQEASPRSLECPVASFVPTVIGVGFALVALCYVVSAVWMQREHRRAPATLPPGMADLDRYELALLAGGRRRLGEVVLVQARLDGLVNVERGAGVLWRALIRFAPDALDGSPHRHPVLTSALYGALRGSRESVVLPPERLMAAAAAAAWIPTALGRLRTLGLLLAPERVGRIQGLRRAASGLQSGMVVPMALLTTMVVFFSTPLLLGKVGIFLPPAGLLGFAGSAVLLYALFHRFGEPAVVVAITCGALVYLAVSPLSLWAVALCGAWLAVYGVFAATARVCGARTRAGDGVLAAARARLPEADAWDYEQTLLAVALFGLPQVRKLARVRISLSVTATGSVPVGGLADFAEQCGQTSDSFVGSAGHGRHYNVDGGPSGFDAGGFGGDGGGGGFGGGFGGDGGGGGGGGGSSGGDG